MPRIREALEELSSGAYADIDVTHKPSEVLQALREEIILRLFRQRGQEFGAPDRVLFLFDEIVTSAQRTLIRGRDH